MDRRHIIPEESAKRGRGATDASQPQEGCPLLHPLQGASCLSTPLQGGILKPPALRVVDDFDGHFPEAGDTEQPFVGAVLDELTCVGAEGCIAANKPEKGVRIE